MQKLFKNMFEGGGSSDGPGSARQGEKIWEANPLGIEKVNVAELSSDEKIEFNFIAKSLAMILEGKEPVSYNELAPATAERLYNGAKLISDHPSLYNLNGEQRQYVNSVLNAKMGGNQENIGFAA